MKHSKGSKYIFNGHVLTIKDITHLDHLAFIEFEEIPNVQYREDTLKWNQIKKIL